MKMLRDRSSMIVLGGVLGFAGSLVCGSAMLLAATGVGGAVVSAGMASMSGMESYVSTDGALGGATGLLVNVGPWLLIVSIVAVAFSLASTRGIAAVPALLSGAILYWGMYVQSDMMLMIAALAAGLTVWLLAYILVYRGPKTTTPAA